MKQPVETVDGCALVSSLTVGSLDCRGPAAAFQDRQLFEGLMERLQHKKWIVYAKPPFGGPAHVLRYLGPYTHRIAISNHRLLAFDRQRVTFRYKDYAHGSKQRIMTLDAVSPSYHSFASPSKDLIYRIFIICSSFN